MLLIFGAVLRNHTIHINFRYAQTRRPELIAFYELHPALPVKVLANGIRSQFLSGAVLHLRCARKQQIDRIYTFNMKEAQIVA